MEKEKIRFEPKEKPKLELRKVISDTSEFQNPEKAQALIQSLRLLVGDKIREDGEENFTINPIMKLEGDSPEHYKKEMEEVKKILTEKEKKSISLYFRKKKEDKKLRDKIYYGIIKRVEKLYNWNDEEKKHIPIKNTKRNIDICESLDKISSMNYMSGFKNIIYHLLSKEDRDYIYCYKCAWFEKPIPNIQEWEEHNDGEYLVLTEREADERAREYLTDDTYLWKCAVDNGNTTESLDEWADSVINYDGRGSVLNGYDGNEEIEEVNGECYCIYRTN